MVIDDVTANEWNHERGFHWKYNCEEPAKGAVIVLHGAGGNRLLEDAGPSLLADGDMVKLFDRLLSECMIVVAPYSGTLEHNGRTHVIWKYSEYNDRGAEMSRITNLIVLGKIHLGLDVYLMGGSAGAIMAYGVAANLHSIGLSHLLSGLILGEGVSPYSISLSGNQPNSYRGVESEHILGDVYYPVHSSDNYLQLGLPNANSKWTIPTLVLYSSEDAIIADELKIDFATKLSSVATDIQVLNSGTYHVVGEEGWKLTYTWLFDLILKRGPREV